MNGYSYDLAGNLLSDGAHTYTYDAENKIAKVDGTAAYVYDGEGQRVRKLLAENLRFVYGIGGQLIAEFNGVNGTLSKEYIYSSSGLVATIEPGSNGTRYLTSDYLGSPRVVTNSSAAVVSRHDFKPFGEALGSGIGGRTTGAGFGVVDGLREQFTSKERDVETGLDYFASRYFASSQGRFTSADSVVGSLMNPQTLNRYSYVGNNPTNFVDPTGHVRLDPPSKGDQGGYLSENPYADAMAWQDTDAIVTAADSAAANASEPDASTELTATVTEDPVEFYVNLPLNTENPAEGPFFTGFASILTITLLEDGKPVAGATGTELVTGSKGERIQQNPSPITTNSNGQTFDVVTRGAFTDTKAEGQAVARAVFDANTQNPVDVTTKMTITLRLPQGGGAEITFQRRITNLDDKGKIRPPGPRQTGPAPNYTITIGPPTVKRLP